MNGRQRVKTLKLTRAGEVKLMAFPPQAREYADIQLRNNKKPVKDLFRFYWSLCKTYCEQKNITPEWRLTFSQMAKEGIDNDAMGIDPKDPYEYEMVIDKQLDPTVTRIAKSDNVSKHSIYATAQLPKMAEPESREKVESNRAKLEALSRSKENPFLALFASQMADMIKFVKTND